MPSEPTSAATDDRSIDERAIDALYEALLWISEYPNRETVYVGGDAVELAEYARCALTAFEEAESNG